MPNNGGDSFTVFQLVAWSLVDADGLVAVAPPSTVAKFVTLPVVFSGTVTLILMANSSSGGIGLLYLHSTFGGVSEVVQMKPFSSCCSGPSSLNPCVSRFTATLTGCSSPGGRVTPGGSVSLIVTTPLVDTLPVLVTVSV